MPIGEHNIMFEGSWNSSAVLLIPSTGMAEKQSENMNIDLNPVLANSAAAGTHRIQCPTCLRLLPARAFGRCVGAPTAEFPLLKNQNGIVSKKRKRTETRSAHEPAVAPCHECLDNLGEDEGASWGRCDNPNCWSRRGESSSSLSSPSSIRSIRGAMRTNFGGDYADDQLDYHFGAPPYKSRSSSPNLGSHQHSALGLVCPKCTPEGGLGCAHKWICDICAFWDKHPLVWECPGCLHDYCDECEETDSEGEEEAPCMECGKRNLCRACRSGRSPESDGPGYDFSFPGRPSLWRCCLCSLPVCAGCVPSAQANRRIDPCRNCHSQLCEGCRSILGCQRCGGEMCQLCLGESLVMLCRKCEDGY